MSTLHFNFEHEDSLELPVEVRKGNSALVARGLSSHSISVEPGIYYVTASLPAGQELTRRVKVQRGDEVQVVTFTPDTNLTENSEIQFISSQANTVSVDIPHLPARLRLFQGNVLTGNCEQVPLRTEAVRSPDGLTLPEMQLLPGQLGFVQLLQPDKPALNMALPTSEFGRCQILIIQLENGDYDLDARLKHPVADAILRYRRRGRLTEISTIVSSESLDAEQLLHDKRADPVAAAVGAYALLRLNELDRLHDWTENLKNWFDWLPDGLTIRAEHLARLGEHTQALELFLELPSRGLPVFSSGISYALNRLRQYHDTGTRYFRAEQIDRAQSLSYQLQRFASVMNASRSLTTFTGLDPSQPDSEPVQADFKKYRGLSVEQLCSSTASSAYQEPEGSARTGSS